MKTITTLCIVILCIALSTAESQGQGFPKIEDLEKNRVARAHGKEILETYTAKVVGVSDGDTLTVLTADKTKIKIRLDSVDAPESKQDFGKRSKQALSELVFGKEVMVQKIGEDRYKRTLASIQIDGKDVATEMVRAGYAWNYREYSVSPTLHDIETKAKEANAGLWSHDKPMAP